MGWHISLRVRGLGVFIDYVSYQKQAQHSIASGALFISSEDCLFTHPFRIILTCTTHPPPGPSEKKKISYTIKARTVSHPIVRVFLSDARDLVHRIAQEDEINGWIKRRCMCEVSVEICTSEMLVRKILDRRGGSRPTSARVLTGPCHRLLRVWARGRLVVFQSLWRHRAGSIRKA